MADTSAAKPLLPGIGNGGDARINQTRALKDLVRKHFSLDQDATIFVAEIKCGEKDCPDTETVIAVMEGRTRREVRVLKPVGAITGADIAAAFKP